jgi:hypothetical protein
MESSFRINDALILSRLKRSDSSRDTEGVSPGEVTFEAACISPPRGEVPTRDRCVRHRDTDAGLVANAETRDSRRREKDRAPVSADPKATDIDDIAADTIRVFERSAATGRAQT